MSIYTIHVHEQCHRCWLKKKKKKTLETSKHKPWTGSKLSLIVRLDAHQHLCVCGFFFSSTCMNSNCTVYAHGFTIQETNCTFHILFTDPQPLYSEKNIKNWSYSTIHTFKNYFVTVFSIFSKISCIQTSLFLSCLFGCSTSI